MEKVDDNQRRQELNTRLSRIEGQVRGIKQMITDERDCDDILIQISAIINSLKGFSKTIIRDHLSNKVVEELKNGNLETVDEIITLFTRID